MQTRVPSPARRRAALFAAFLLTGVAMATWITRTPAIRDATGAGTAEMGVIIAGLSAGSMVGIALGGTLVSRLGGRWVVRRGLTGLAVGVAVVAAGASLQWGWLVALGLAVFGYGMGSGEIGLNVEGVLVEALLERTVVPSLHGSFSLGICAGGLLGLAANGWGVPVAAHLLAVSVLTLGTTLWVAANLPVDTGIEPVRAEKGRGNLGAALAVWREPRTVAIAVVILGMALAEGTANDWLPLIMVDGFGMSAAVGASVFAFFGASMAVGRFCGGYFLDRFGRTPVLLVSAASAVAGIAVVSFAPDVVTGALGVFLWGLGSSLGFPVALSAAGDDPVDSARRVSAVAAAGYAAFLVGPPLLGLIGELTSLRTAILFSAAVVAVSVLFVRSIAKPVARKAETA